MENRGRVSEILDEAKASWGWVWWGGEGGEVFGFGELRRLRGRERGESKGCRESRGCYGSGCCGQGPEKCHASILNSSFSIHSTFLFIVLVGSPSRRCHFPPDVSIFLSLFFFF